MLPCAPPPPPPPPLFCRPPCRLLRLSVRPALLSRGGILHSDPPVFRRAIKHSSPVPFLGVKNSLSSSVSPLIQPIGLLGERVAESMTHPDARELSSLIINTPGSYELKKGLEGGWRWGSDLKSTPLFHPHRFLGDGANSACKNIFWKLHKRV